MVKYMVTRLSKPNPVTGKPPKSEKVPGFGQKTWFYKVEDNDKSDRGF